MLLIWITLFGAVIFKTNAITDNTPSLVNDLHILSGAIVILTFPIAAFLVVRGLAWDLGRSYAQRWLLWGTLLVWFWLLAFLGSIVVSNVIHPGAGRVGPEVLLGWPNGFMVATYIAWLVIAALRARLTGEATAQHRVTRQRSDAL